MKTFIFLLTLLSANQAAQACSCSDYPLDPTAAITRAAKMAAGFGRATSIDVENGIKQIKVYPNLGEFLNIEHFKGSSCEVFGPNHESLFYCATTRRADYEVTVKSRAAKCTVTVHAVSKLKSISARATRVDQCEFLHETHWFFRRINAEFDQLVHLKYLIKYESADSDPRAIKAAAGRSKNKKPEDFRAKLCQAD